MFYIFAIFALCIPTTVWGAVVVNEVAWMGTTVSSNDEWIELRNTDDAPVSLSDWMLKSGNGSLQVVLLGSIPANGYFLLERSDDESAPNVPADQIYTGSLTNAGDTLTLIDQNGATKDSVVGGENWENIGGDNTSKDTAQRNGSNWITAPGTPKRTNATSGSQVSTAPTESPKTTTTQKQTTNAATKIIPENEILVSGGEDRSVLIRTPVSFGATALGHDKKPIPNATFTWTFGDGTTAEGRQVVHQFQAPGEYVVVVNAGNIDVGSTAADRIIVRAAEPLFSLILNTDGSLSLHNDSEEDVDIGGLLLTGSGKQFTIPLRTIVLGNGAIRFVKEVTGFSGDESSTLLYQNSMPVVGAEKARNVSASPLVSKRETVLTEKREAVKEKPEAVAKLAKNTVAEVDSSNAVEESELMAGAADSVPEGSHQSLFIWVLALITLLGAAIGAVTIIRRIEPMSKGAPTLTAADFKIIEED